MSGLACPASVAALALLLGISGCSAPVAPSPQPAFYADLARPGAVLDPVSAGEIINAYRAQAGLAPLLWDERLQRLAETEARRLADRGDLSDGGGAGIVAALAAAGYAPPLVKRSVTGGYHRFADAFSGWRGAPGHDAVLRAREGRRFAIAAVARPGSRHRVYWVMLVAP
jgi:uncharacterized protein YkwD